MSDSSVGMASFWQQVGTRLLPFADAATKDLPLSRLLRLSLFQFTVGLCLVLLNGTLNRVMIVELGVAASLVAAMISLPVLFAPLRALVGHQSDQFRSLLGWRRVPFIYFGTIGQFGGLAIMPFALIILSGDTSGPVWIGTAGAALAFVLVGAGLHTTQTAGLALATDLATPETRPRVVALLYVMLLVGMVLSAVVFSLLLENFSQLRLIQVIQGSAVLCVVLNFIALWKQEARQPEVTRPDRERPAIHVAWRELNRDGRSRRLLWAVALGTAAFSMQDVLLEPYGGEVLSLAVGQTTLLTALLALGTLAALGWAAVWLKRGGNEFRIAGLGALVGVAGFVAVIFSAPLDSAVTFRIGTLFIGVGTGLFSVATLIAAMALTTGRYRGLALGAWGAVQATAVGVGIALGGGLRDLVSALAVQGALGPALTDPATGYGFVYHLEIALLFATLVAIGPLVRKHSGGHRSSQFGLAEFPG